MRGLFGRYLTLRIWFKKRWDKLRYVLVSTAFEKAGRRGSVGRNVRFLGNLTIEVGDRVAIRDNVQFGGNGALSIGGRTSINEGCIITALERIDIGSDVMLAPRVYVLDVDHRFAERSVPISAQGYDVRPVTIGDGVWVGAGAIITKGVTIGEGAIVGANSVVTRDLPPFSVAGGVPARFVKDRPK